MAFALRGGGAGIGLFLSWLVFGLVGPAGAGLYFTAVAAQQVVLALGKRGFERVMVRSVAGALATGDVAAIHGAQRFAMGSAMRFSVVVALLFAALAWPLAEWVFRKEGLAPLLALMALTVPPAVLVQLYSAGLRALRRIATAQAVVNLVIPGAACLLLTSCVAAFGVAGTAVAYVLAAVLALVLAHVAWRRFAPPLVGSPTVEDPDALRVASQSMLHTDLMNRLMITLPTLLLMALWESTEDVGVFGVALRSALLLGFVQQALTAILNPKFAELWKRGKLDEIRDLARRSAWLGALVASPLAVLLFVFPENVLRWFDAEAVSGANALIILTVAQMVNIASGPMGGVLVMSGNERRVRNATVWALGLLAVGCLVLVPLYGALGAAIAAGVGVVFKNVANVVLARRHLNIPIL